MEQDANHSNAILRASPSAGQERPAAVRRDRDNRRSRPVTRERSSDVIRQHQQNEVIKPPSPTNHIVNLMSLIHDLI